MRCLLSLGSNLGDRGAALRTAVAQLQATEGIDRLETSGLYRTPSIGGPKNQPDFLNAAATLHTDLSASDLLGVLHRIESHGGRIRSDRWEARPIDLDIIFYGDWIGSTQSLGVPHPRYAARRFVIEPAAEIAGDFVDPRFHWSIARLRQHLATGPPSLILIGDDRQRRGAVVRALRSRNVNVVCPGEPAPPSPSDDRYADRQRPRVYIEAAAVEDLPIDSPLYPRLGVRLFRHPPPGDWRQWFPSLRDATTEPEHPWPAPHRLWVRGRDYPEYPLDISDPGWAAEEIASALESMRCPCERLDDAAPLIE